MTDHWNAGEPGHGLAEVVVERLLAISRQIGELDLPAALKGIDGWHAGVDLTPVPVGVLQETSDRLRRARAFLTVEPIEPRTAIEAVQEAVDFWQARDRRGR